MESIDYTAQKADQQTAGMQIFKNSQTRSLVCCLLLALATLALYSPVGRDPFLNYDDQVYVTDNPHVHAGLTWNTVVWAFRTTEATNWHPITWLSHALDYQLFGSGAAGPHIVNVLLHAANAILLFLILQKATGASWRSLMVAGIFALHPLNVESVAWISERKNVLSMFFFLLALAAYGWYVRRPGAGRYLAVTAAYALGLMSKPQVITFPCALLLLDYWPLGRLSPEQPGNDFHPPVHETFWKLVLEKLPWFALSAASAIVTMKVQAQAVQQYFSPWAHVGNAALAYAKYIGKAFWPVDLAAVYPHPEGNLNSFSALLALFAIVAVSILAMVFRRNRFFFVGWFWFLGTMVPMSGLVQVGFQGMADRYAYIPLLGIFVIVCWGAAKAAERWEVPASATGACACAVLLALAFMLQRQVSLWNDNATLWAHTVQVTGPNFFAEEMLGTALISDGRGRDAFPHLQRAHDLRPAEPMAALNLATFHQMVGNYQAALDGYAAVIQNRETVVPLLAIARTNSGYAHLSLKQFESARPDFLAALQAQPSNATAYRGLGLAEQGTGNLPEAIRNYQQAAQLDPSPVNFLLLAQALEGAGQLDAARAARTQAISIHPSSGDDKTMVKRLLGQ